jgi:phosphohistidine phosphatase
MVIYLSQHGKALSREENINRPLSPKGVRDCESVAKFLKNKGFIINKIFHSGKLRSEESARIFSTILSNGDIVERAGLKPNDAAKDFCDDLCEDSLYIGHLPQLEKVLSLLLLNDDSLNIVKFKNSGVICLEKIDDVYSIKWYVSPNLLEV